jgi:hypothetical protein
MDFKIKNATNYKTIDYNHKNPEQVWVYLIFYSAALKQMNSRALNRAQRYKRKLCFVTIIKINIGILLMITLITCFSECFKTTYSNHFLNHFSFVRN